MPIRVEPQAEPIPGYKLIERLGSGGFGEVWKAEAPGGLLKAIKFVYGDMQSVGEEAQRAGQELKALSRVSSVRHPYILSLERWDIIDGRLMIVMELADRNVWDRFKECRAEGRPGIPREELLRYLEETAEALDLMNTQYGLQHLDIKPQNLFLVYNHIKVADFGLVKDLRGRLAATITGGVTPVYAAPETFDGYVTRFCDQYSLAIVYQELLTGQRPFAGNNVHQLVMQHMQGKPKLDQLPADDQPIISRALAKNPDDRHHCCMDMVLALRSAGVVRRVEVPPAPADEPPADVNGAEVLDRPRDAETDSSSATALNPRLAARGGSGPRKLKPAAPVEAEPVQVPLEITGEGQLVPALVVGLGQTGLLALKQMREELQDRFGSLDALPHLRLLYLDTDPNGQAEATELGGRGALSRREVMIARVNRAGHYLSPRNGRPRIDTWFDTHMLYRIRRNLVTDGVRAVGRLAFCGNYRLIALRLQAELAACMDPEALATAARHTRLGVRSNQPRIYVVSSLAGGTGSGMFIDLAYVVRHLLQKSGCPHPEVVGLFLLPSALGPQASALALGNTYAALTELEYFSAPEITFAARYEEREAPVTNPDPPYTRCLFQAAVPESPEALDKARRAGEYLCLELTTPLGRVAEDLRLARTALGPPGAPVCQSFGVSRYSWPRRALLQEASRRFCHQLVQRWLAKGTKPLHETAQGWVREQWAEKNLGAEALIGRFQDTCLQALGREPEAAFAALTAPLLEKGRNLTEADRDLAVEALGQLEQLLGRPADSSILQRTGSLEEALRSQGEPLNAEWQRKLGEMTLDLVDHPSFRLAGAEEALRQAGHLVEQILTHHEPLGHELAQRAAKECERLYFLVARFPAIFQGRRATQLLPELLDLLKIYPKHRYQSLVLRRVIYTFTSLRGYLSDQVREIGFYRLRLGELLASFQQTAAPAAAESERTTTFLYPQGCANLDEAVDRLFPETTSAELDDLDQRTQQLVEHQFRSLRHVCTTPSLPLRSLEMAMLTEAEAFVGARLTETNVVDTYFQLHPGEQEPVDGLLRAFAKAAPLFASSEPDRPSDLSVLAVPFGQEETFQQLLTPVLPEARVVATSYADDLVFYREESQLALRDLEQLGPAGEEAYQQLQSLEHFTPHCRIDIDF